MVNMCRAGEVGGFLDRVLLQIADNFEAEVKLRGKIKAAMTYPVVVFCIAILAVIGMLLFIVPVFANMFTQPRRHAAGCRPGSWSILSHAMKFLAARSCIVGASSASSSWGRVKHQEQVRASSTRSSSRCRSSAACSSKVALSRFTRNLGTMLRSGVPILQSLDIVADTTGNIVISRARPRRAGAASAAASPSPGRWPSTASSRRWSCR